MSAITAPEARGFVSNDTLVCGNCGCTNFLPKPTDIHGIVGVCQRCGEPEWDAMPQSEYVVWVILKALASEKGQAVITHRKLALTANIHNHDAITAILGDLHQKNRIQLRANDGEMLAYTMPEGAR